MTDTHIEIETVAEVTYVERESVSVNYYPDDRLVTLSQSSSMREYQSIRIPLDKVEEVVAAMLKLAVEAGS